MPMKRSTASGVRSACASIGSRSSIPYRREVGRPAARSARVITSSSTGPRRLPTWTVPDGVFESLMTWGPETRAASSSAQNTAFRGLVDADDREGDRPGRSLHRDLVALLVTHQRRPDRRLVADPPVARRRLGRSNDDERLGAFRSLDDDLGADADAVLVGRLVQLGLELGLPLGGQVDRLVVHSTGNKKRSKLRRRPDVPGARLGRAARPPIPCRERGVRRRAIVGRAAGPVKESGRDQRPASTSPTIRPAKAIRYRLKTVTERLRSQASRKPMASIPEMAAAPKPAAMASHSMGVCVSMSSLREPYSPAPRVIGVASRKLKRAALSRVRPSARPAVMVAPERLIPGNRASAWERPIATALRASRPSISRRRQPSLSASHRPAAPSTTKPAIARRTPSLSP